MEQTHLMNPIFLYRYISKIAENSVQVVFLRKWSNTPEMLLHLYPCSQQTKITCCPNPDQGSCDENGQWASWL